MRHPYSAMMIISRMGRSFCNNCRLIEPVRMGTFGTRSGGGEDEVDNIGPRQAQLR